MHGVGYARIHRAATDHMDRSLARFTDASFERFGMETMRGGPLDTAGRHGSLVASLSLLALSLSLSLSQPLPLFLPPYILPSHLLCLPLPLDPYYSHTYTTYMYMYMYIRSRLLHQHWQLVYLLLVLLPNQEPQHT